MDSHPNVVPGTGASASASTGPGGEIRPPKRITPPSSKVCWILDDDDRTKRARELLIPLCVTAAILAALVSGSLLLIGLLNPGFWGTLATLAGLAGTGGASLSITRKWWIHHNGSNDI